MRRWRDRALVLAGLAAGALLLRLVYGTGLVGFDTSVALVWGDDLAHGRVPDFDSPFSPTPHPLSYLALAPVSLLGDDAYAVVEALSWLSLALLGYAAFRLGSALFRPVVGAGFALVLVTRPALVDETAQAIIDIPCLALVLLAAAHEARRPGDWRPVLVLLALAGLLRPEAWLLAALYALYAMRGRDTRVKAATAALAAAGPALWAFSDLLVTGDPLYSLHHTQDAAERVGHRRGLGDAIELAPTYLGEMVRDPIVWCGLAGFVLTLYLLYERALLPGAILVLGLGGFLVLGLFGLPLLRRYMFPAGAMLALFAVVGVTGWTLLGRDDRRRRAWMAIAAASLVVMATSVPGTVDSLGEVRDKAGAMARAQDSLRATVAAPPVGEALRRCGGAAVADIFPGATLAYGQGVALADLDLVLVPPPRGLFLGPRSEAVARYYVYEEAFRVVGHAPRGLRPVSASAEWGVWARC